MKFVSSAVFALSLITGVQSFADTAPVKVPVGFGKIYSVEGFDNNDNVQIVGVGLYPNSCFRNADTPLQIDHAKKTIRVAPLAYKYGGDCLQVMMPFDRVVDLGILQEGTYTVIQDKSPQPLGQIHIHHTDSQSADDMMYAPISQAYFQNDKGTSKVSLSGEFPLSCMKIKEVKFNVQPEVLVVQPVAELSGNVPCTKGAYPFTVTTDVGAIKSGRYLLHVRSMNGKAVNNLVDVP